MAVSKDGFMARHDRDDMSWLGRDDKSLFRALTSVGGDCWVGRRSAGSMPPDLPGRTLHLLGTGPGLAKLDCLRYRGYDSHWLLGGQELALKALGLALVDGSGAYPPMLQEIHLCRSDRCAFPDDRRHFDRITPALMAYGLTPAMRTRFGDVTHEVWRLEHPIPRID
jgi:hypothetical protein